MPKVTNWQEYLVAIMQQTPAADRLALVEKIGKRYGTGFATLLLDMVQADELVRDNEKQIKR